ncbi:ATP-binding cassette domain-containing protein [Anaerolinea thermophila]|uniref:ABC transporter ATP-binding protein n=1 Tax=Anaerolinea thermophila (strain DSM 14523 / JCM 11388 / NBRC 100420 / UNI-1) TaxID=926569 RepID=E8N639_ANATU|nr:ATP-binding cassette domain-containing protein [Anaerolinea thermophila]BAJ63903.1 putative ABC transporter ATP-binding protein [Anaerolinea thermophila UNI-1]
MPNQMTAEPLIVCENLVKIYKIADLEVVALQGLDLVVPRKEMLAIVGASGSGKTTLMNILGGLDRPSAGKVTVDEIDLLSLSDEALNEYQRTKVGFVWQQTSRNLIPYLTAEENIELPMIMSGVHNKQQRREWAHELLNSVGLFHRRHHQLIQLSGGEQQRIAIAVALANRPVLLLGDEPTGEVDSATARTIMETFSRLREELDLTIVIVSHDPRIAEQVDRVVAIRDGKIATETVRQVSQLEALMAGGASGSQEILLPSQVTYKEFVMLDSAGRLQIPKEIREELGIGKRVEMQIEDGRIIIKPVEGEGGEPLKNLTIEEQIAILFSGEKVPQRKPGSVKKLKWLRWR